MNTLESIQNNSSQKVTRRHLLRISSEIITDAPFIALATVGAVAIAKAMHDQGHTSASQKPEKQESK